MARGQPMGLASVYFRVLVLRALSIASTLAFTSLMSFIMAKDDYGSYVTILSVALAVTTLANAGQGELAMRELSKMLALQNPSAALEFEVNSLLLTGIAALLISLLAFFVMHLAQLHQELAIWVALLVPILAVEATISGIARARGWFFWAFFPREVLWRMLILAGSATVLFTAVASDLDAGMAGGITLVASLTIIALEALLFLRRRFPWPSAAGFRSFLSGHFFSSVDLAIVNFANLFFFTADIVIVSVLLGSEAVAEYYPANRIAILTIYLQITIQAALAPQFAQAFAKEDLQFVKRTSRQMTAATAVASALIFLVLAAGSGYLPVVFPTITPAGTFALLALSGGQVVNVALGFGNVILVAAGRERVVRKTLVWSIPLGGLLMCAGAYGFGIAGVAASSAFVAIARKFVLARISKRALGFTGGL